VKIFGQQAKGLITPFHLCLEALQLTQPVLALQGVHLAQFCCTLECQFPMLKLIVVVTFDYLLSVVEFYRQITSLLFLFA
jgi:hypothetical protein